jgi:hypothetical protein
VPASRAAAAGQVRGGRRGRGAAATRCGGTAGGLAPPLQRFAADRCRAGARAAWYRRRAPVPAGLGRRLGACGRCAWRSWCVRSGHACTRGELAWAVLTGQGPAADGAVCRCRMWAGRGGWVGVAHHSPGLRTLLQCSQAGHTASRRTWITAARDRWGVAWPPGSGPRTAQTSMTAALLRVRGHLQELSGCSACLVCAQ